MADTAAISLGDHDLHTREAVTGANDAIERLNRATTYNTILSSSLDQTSNDKEFGLGGLPLQGQRACRQTAQANDPVIFPWAAGFNFVDPRMLSLR